MQPHHYVVIVLNRGQHSHVLKWAVLPTNDELYVFVSSLSLFAVRSFIVCGHLMKQCIGHFTCCLWTSVHYVCTPISACFLCSHAVLRTHATWCSFGWDYSASIVLVMIVPSPPAISCWTPVVVDIFREKVGGQSDLTDFRINMFTGMSAECVSARRL